MSASTSGASCIGTASTWGQTGLTPARRPTPSPAAPRSTPASPEVLACPPPAGRYQLEAGLHYNWHRSYDPTIGRYTQPDPLGFVDGPSVYGYAGADPAGQFDYTGRQQSGRTNGRPGPLPFSRPALDYSRPSAPSGGAYVLTNFDGVVFRCGRTNDLGRREREHLRQNPDYQFREVVRTDSRNEQRGIEQMLHDEFGGPLNKIRPISPTNPRLEEYLNSVTPAQREFLMNAPIIRFK